MFQEAFLAGVWASIGSTLGKLSGIPNLLCDTNVLINGEELSFVDTAVFLGITLDARLQWGPDISQLASRLSSAAYAGGNYVIWASLLAAMVMSNTWGCRYYLRSLDASTNSVAPTVISAASSYVLSGVIGVTLFDEGATARWFLGVFFIVLGLVLVAQPRKRKDNKLE